MIKPKTLLLENSGSRDRCHRLLVPLVLWCRKWAELWKDNGLIFCHVL